MPPVWPRPCMASILLGASAAFMTGTEECGGELGPMFAVVVETRGSKFSRPI
jgi:hypothetical protein